MLILYTSPVCPFCHRVSSFARAQNIDLDERNIVDDANRAQLLERGGKMQVPFFVDEERDTAMYESGDIIAYLQEHYAR